MPYDSRVTLHAVILAAGMGTRLGRPFPKPLTPLHDGRSILRQQVDNLRGEFGEEVLVTIVVGFKMDLVMEAASDVSFVYNEIYDQTNTSKSLLKALSLSPAGGVLWLNGDVVFDEGILGRLRPFLEEGRSVVCVNTSSVAEEEVKYTLDAAGHIAELSKQVLDGLGEAIGINYVSATDKPAIMARLRECSDQDYFERGIELAIASDGIEVSALDISDLRCVEVDFDADLATANSLFG